MKSKRWADGVVLCPFYKYQDAQMVFCKGMEEGNAIHNAFSTPRQRKDFQEKYCRSKYDDCWICEAHMKLYQEEHDEE